ncbi:unnamed protein product [Mytilus coruscus]|uniref:DZIP3-like HEPN domain-containing protein n=1 Tax=Mytilus coruscus TaxID=42192 RepID=A0A6J8D164_MYTCO|nr:unnamed protein product [Mytilus coruscus]
MRTWNTDYPLKCIYLEKCLQEKKKELPIITFQELKHISTETCDPLRNDELILFLRYHHEIRALLSKSSKATPEANSKTETTSENQTNSTKLTKEESNFAKMGMIVLNILTDVLYDLLKHDKTFVLTRSDCDTTYLYRMHRRINKHIPSNRWGGTWQNIQSTDISIGDDIERIRLTRNEIFHSETF